VKRRDNLEGDFSWFDGSFFFRFRFYYPQGKPILPQHLDLVLKKVQAAFEAFPNQQVARHNFGAIAKVSLNPHFPEIAHPVSFP